VFTLRFGPRWPLALLGSAMIAVTLFLQGIRSDGGLAWVWAALMGAGAGFVMAPLSSRHARPDRATVPLAIASIVATLAGVCYVGANTPEVRWFGALVAHGPRSGNEVAITFDDGPDATYTLQVATILEQHDARGTFFLVGKAVDAVPDIARQLYARGHLLANHSYHHDAWRWLDPFYPELARANASIKKAVGVCPTFYRPPHGQRTPFVGLAVSNAHMRMVTWDSSGGDWSTHDGALVARRVLAHVRPGSIIDLHDGLDGKVHADRSVLLSALPKILDGLAARGLQPVTLDRLLGVDGYRSAC
jgi:peptidoglycan-N-acetylglucosamine deacetylase